MLSHLSCRNFRALEKIEVPLDTLTAIVGPNGSGKTSILSAINLVFGESWPSLRSFRIPQDFTNFDSSRQCAIRVSMDPPYIHSDVFGKEHEVAALQVVCKPYVRKTKHGAVGDLHVDVDPVNREGKTLSVPVGRPTKGVKTQYRPLAASTALRDFGSVLFVDHRRSLSQHYPGRRGSVLGRLLEPARRDFDLDSTDFGDKYELAMDVLRTEKVREIESRISETAKRMLGFLGSSASDAIDIGFGFSDPANPFSSLRLQYVEGGLAIPGEDLGLGIQSAMVVGIFEALREIGGGYGTIIIEEPEMYLHPQAQRYFFRLLSEIASPNECQVIYSTHSPVFADVNRFETLRLVRREPGSNSTVTYVQKGATKVRLDDARKMQKLAGQFDSARNEVLFAKRALLVEGQGDRFAALIVAEKIGLDVDAEGIAVIDCGGKNGLPLVASVCRALKIPFTILHDEDIWPLPTNGDTQKQQGENDTARRANDRIVNAVEDESVIFKCEPTLEELLQIGRSASDKPRRVVEALEPMTTEQVPEVLVRAVRSLSVS